MWYLFPHFLLKPLKLSLFFIITVYQNAYKFILIVNKKLKILFTSMIEINGQVYIKLCCCCFRYFWSYILDAKEMLFFFQKALRFYENLFSLHEKRKIELLSYYINYCHIFIWYSCETIVFLTYWCKDVTTLLIKK